MIQTHLATTHDLFINELTVLGSRIMSDFTILNIISLTPSCIQGWLNGGAKNAIA